MAKRNYKDIYQSVTDQLIEAMESGVSPWQKPWENSGQIEPSLPFNACGGNHYSGINVCLLWASAQKCGYTTNAWLTYKQAGKLGGHVRKGEHGQSVVFWKIHEKGDKEDTKRFPFARSYTVFNVEQCEGIEGAKVPDLPEPVEPDEVITWAGSTGAIIRHGGNRACFIPSADLIQLPRPEQFVTSEGYHATALHELTHWTGHKSRLDRQYGARFADDAYSFEELVAEIGSSFLCASIGVPYEIEDHASYVDHWLGILKEDKRAIFKAASDAQKACKYVLETAQTYEKAA